MWHKVLIKSGSLFFQHRNCLFTIFYIGILLFTRPAFFLGNPQLDRFAVALGVMIALVGAAFRLLVIGFAYIKRGGKNGRVYADNLVIEGVYAHVRNPMYISNFFIVVGIGIIYGSAWIYFLAIPFFSFAYLAIMVTEEDYLRRRFGAEYDEYCRRVNRFFPNFKGIRNSLKEYQYDWRKVIRKDYGTVFGMLVGCYATWLWKQYYFYGLPSSMSDIRGPVFVFIVFGIGYSFFRYLKKSGRLKSPSG